MCACTYDHYVYLYLHEQDNINIFCSRKNKIFFYGSKTKIIT